ncbi:MAG: hypothetical protein GDA53_03965 [Rhodobacteraceae bacterium]|nr:hypothetical protein [Paracoccaceae bacterium]
MPDRHPKALAKVVILLAWVNLAVSGAGHPVKIDILRTLERLSPASAGPCGWATEP